MKSGVHDVRLFLDGQLVGQWPDPDGVPEPESDPATPEGLVAWRQATAVQLGCDGKQTRTFRVRLPRREGLKEVEFSAYA
ncbi:MAG TPA: hypothetical protein VG099_29305, partial [Gemmataceae bacterium]|nr:hypothetical protein [Gemmataceae bacterium]